MILRFSFDKQYAISAEAEPGTAAVIGSGFGRKAPMQQVKDPQFMTQYGHSIPVFRKTGILSLSAADGSAAPAYEKGVGVYTITPFVCCRVVLCKETELHNQEMTSAYHPLSQFAGIRWPHSLCQSRGRFSGSSRNRRVSAACRSLRGQCPEYRIRSLPGSS